LRISYNNIFAICTSSLWKGLYNFFAHVLMELHIVLFLNFLSSLIWLLTIYQIFRWQWLSLMIYYVSSLCWLFLWMYRIFFKFYVVPIISSCLHFLDIGAIFRKLLPLSTSWSFSFMFSSSSFKFFHILSWFFKGERFSLISVFLYVDIQFSKIHLMKKLSCLQRMLLAQFPKIRWL
jgi:hypothetical protein